MAQETQKPALYRIQEIKDSISRANAAYPLDIMLMGCTGAGKSSTLNALLGKDQAQVGHSAATQTKTIESYMLNKFVRIWDTPGLGDDPRYDEKYIKEMITHLHKKISAGDRDVHLIDLVLVLIEGSKRDLGTTYEIFAKILDGNIQASRVLFVINQADMAMSGRHWDNEKNAPDETLKAFLDKQSEAVALRLKESFGIEFRQPLYYSATNGFNIYALLDYIIDNHIWEARVEKNKEKSKDSEKPQKVITATFGSWF